MAEVIHLEYHLKLKIKEDVRSGELVPGGYLKSTANRDKIVMQI